MRVHFVFPLLTKLSLFSLYCLLCVCVCPGGKVDEWRKTAQEEEKVAKEIRESVMTPLFFLVCSYGIDLDWPLLGFLFPFVCPSSGRKYSLHQASRLSVLMDVQSGGKVMYETLFILEIVSLRFVGSVCLSYHL